ncbi:MAG: NUDIX hydrolase [Acidimicrobiales bacterium]
MSGAGPGSGAGPVAEMRAAGGAVWRRSGGTIEVLLVHRPSHDDWSLPKGKADPGEDDLACALREVEEETAVRGRAGPELATVRYLDRDGRRKVVRYWAMEPASAGVHEPDDEIDEVSWLPLGAALRRMTYQADRAVLEALVGWLGRP